MIGAIASFSAMAIAGRELGKTIPTFEIMMYRSIIGLLIIIGIGIFAFRVKNPQKYEEVKESLQDYWENLRTYFDK